MKNLGVHLRMNTCLADVLEQARFFDISCFQFFLTNAETGKYIIPSQEERKSFLSMRDSFNTIYIHSSYWINLATHKEDSYQISQRLLKQEVEIAESLRISSIVLHPGSATGHPRDMDPEEAKAIGISNITNALNTILSKTKTVSIILENAAHGNATIGSNLDDFITIKQQLAYPERVGFCLDFAHAFVYGYDLSRTKEFLDNVNKTVGLDKLQLIHLNDAAEAIGSKKDKHQLPGKGLIGMDAIVDLCSHKSLINLPKIIEPPRLLPKTIQKALASLAQL